MKTDDLIRATFSEVLEKKLLQEMSSYGMFKSVDTETIVLEIRRDVRFIPFVLSGVVKVMRRDGHGNGIMLHYIPAGHTSALSVTYALQDIKSEIRLKSEGEVSYIAVPVKVVISWFDKFKSWTAYYNRLNQEQTSRLINGINDIAFMDLEYRLTKYLEEYSTVFNSNVIPKKHFDIARDLKVSREAVSRTLKKMELDELIVLGRNKIILD
jgi:CRP/FNR family transcriptional regulator